MTKKNTRIGDIVDEQLTVEMLFGAIECAICQESFKITDEVAEMHVPGTAGESKIVHGQCGLWEGMEVS